MKPTATLEAKIISKATSTLETLLGQSRSNRAELRLQLLEAAASRLGGFDLEGYQKTFGIETLRSPTRLIDDARILVQSIEGISIHPALTLSALAREALDESKRRTNGAYHTDFRLALSLAQSVEDRLSPEMRILDPACGAGILLIATSLIACGSDRILTNEWLRHSIYAADLSPSALRGTLLSLATLTDDLEVLAEMYSRWRAQDSLLSTADEWRMLTPKGFDLVIANPPWEKIKLSRHEYAKASGDCRHYGSSYKKEALTGYGAAKSKKAQTAALLVEKYPTLSKGEPDLYVAFTELLINLTRAGGSGALLVPAGLIRSLNTQPLRETLLNNSAELTFTVMENRARHFAIDTRFKFLLVNYIKSSKTSKRCKTIGLAHAMSNDEGIKRGQVVSMPISVLQKLRPDLTLPEIKNPQEWRLFRKMQYKGTSPNHADSPWHPAFCREADMTHCRKNFLNKPGKNRIPVIEGRMVQPHRIGCKAYVSGEGRRAIWHNLAPGSSVIAPQFWMPLNKLPKQAQSRVGALRAGFCDITGQTNERSMMAALIPSGVVCGNKVPTVLFPNDPSEERFFLWLGIVNSIPFDWLVRRIVTTTVNYFVLLSLNLPILEPNSLPGHKLIEISKQLLELDNSGQSSFETYWRIALLKAEADVIVATAYGCTEADLHLILNDFPLLDRGQPPLPGEKYSTITHDLFMATWSRRNTQANAYAARVAAARECLAIPYLSSEFAASTQHLREAFYEQ